MKERALVLLSGGLDSSTTLAVAKDEGFDASALSFDYGQRHRVELEAAKKVARALGVRDHRIVRLDFTFAETSALTSRLAVPKSRKASEMATGIPITYVPARNTIFLSYALGVAEVVRASNIFIGVNALDYSGYPDCRPEFITAFEKLANLATKTSIEGKKFRIHTPLLRLTKAQIIQLGRRLNVDFSLTSSCYDPSAKGLPCGKCDSCQLRLKGFKENGISDPVQYA